MRITDLETIKIDDPLARENFYKLSEFFRDSLFLFGSFKHFEFKVNAPSANFKFKHNLGFLPKDIFITNISNGAVVSIIYAQTSFEHIVFDADAACTIRFIAGSVPLKIEG